MGANQVFRANNLSIFAFPELQILLQVARDMK